MRSFVFVIPLALAFAATPVTISIAAPQDAVLISAKKKKPQRAYRAQQQYVACTPLGCHPTPPGCRPERGMDWWGNPYAYDVVVCR
ncbi:MAG: hypothetical protein JO245_10360 [Pseudolabrys sp.]|nr:hypothetical protein [Pseudolabrys sp.]